jgi:hypothetical protein
MMDDRAHADADRAPVAIASGLAILADVRSRIDELAARLASDPTARLSFDFMRDAADELDGLLA